MHLMIRAVVYLLYLRARAPGSVRQWLRWARESHASQFSSCCCRRALSYSEARAAGAGMPSIVPRLRHVHQYVQPLQYLYQ